MISTIVFLRVATMIRISYKIKQPYDAADYSLLFVTVCLHPFWCEMPLFSHCQSRIAVESSRKKLHRDLIAHL